MGKNGNLRQRVSPELFQVLPPPELS